MACHKALKISVLVTAVLLLAGCEQMYNGSWGLRSADKERAVAYQQFKAEREKQLEQAQLEERRAMPVAFDLPGGANGANAVRPRYASNMADRSLGGMGLYGSVGRPSVQRSSPLDATGNLKRVTFTTEGADFDPDTDPTGQLITYASTRHRTTSDLYVKRVDGTAVTQLTEDPANDVMPCFSPDGKRIAFASDRAGNWDIYIMDTSGGQPMQVTSSPAQDIHPSFSPDGNRLVYCSYGATSGQWEMVVIDLTQPQSRRIIGHGLFPTWSPVSDQILFQRARQRGTRWFSVWTIDLENGEAVRPTEIAVSSNAAVITPDWSPDGKHIVFCTVIDPEADNEVRPARADMWISDLDGKARVKVSSGKHSNLLPTWANDGSIYFVSDRAMEGVETVWSVRPDRAVQVASTPTGSDFDSEAPSVMVPTE